MHHTNTVRSFITAHGKPASSFYALVGETALFVVQLEQTGKDQREKIAIHFR
jgi:hypothetical protein